MSNTLILIFALIHAGACVALLFERNIPMAVVLFGYTLSDFGLLLVVKALERHPSVF